jgi:hypothetical protein
MGPNRVGVTVVTFRARAASSATGPSGTLPGAGGMAENWNPEILKFWNPDRAARQFSSSPAFQFSSAPPLDAEFGNLPMHPTSPCHRNCDRSFPFSDSCMRHAMSNCEGPRLDVSKESRRVWSGRMAASGQASGRVIHFQHGTKCMLTRVFQGRDTDKHALNFLFSR